MRAKLIEGPAREPVELEAVKAHLRETESSQDALIAMYLQAAREHVEATTGARCIQQEWRLALDAFPTGRLALPGYPLVEVTALQYVDPEGTTQALDVSGLYINTAARPGWIELPAGWPATKDQAGAVTIDYTVGFGTLPGDVPAGLRNAILLLVGDLFENRQAAQKDALVENRAVASLLWPFRTMAP